jgi:alpha-L-fucosidase
MFKPTLDSLNGRVIPPWFDEAKFGIFIHWGMWAVPAFAPNRYTIGEVFAKYYDEACAMTPYAEWYCNAIKTPGTPSAEFHAKTYGGAPYASFREAFLDGLRDWDPDAWAETFRDAGARYVVLVTKHHDGFCLWPTGFANRHQGGWRTERDVVGELAEAVRRQGMRFGVYYSGGFDWTFNRAPLRTLGDVVSGAPRGAYPAYADAQVRELIDRYQPSVVWNDISWPDREERLFEMFAYYYNTVGEGVVNDRWVTPNKLSRSLRNRRNRAAFDAKMKPLVEKGGGVGGVVPAEVPHCDFRTPEYATFSTIQTKKWEATRGMTNSFGYNRNDRPSDYESFESLLTSLIESVARFGNLLLNVGPRGVDSRIPDEQLARLKAFGDWLRPNGAAIYGSRPWSRSDGSTADGRSVRFTISKGRLNLIFLGPLKAGQVVVKDVTDVKLASEAIVLNGAIPVTVTRQGDDVVLTLPNAAPDAFAPVIAVPLAS